MATTEKLQNEILLKEEAFLKEEKAKLTEQLNKLKVEEMALMKLLQPGKKAPQHTTMELFTKNSHLVGLCTIIVYIMILSLYRNVMNHWIHGL